MNEILLRFFSRDVPLFFRRFRNGALAFLAAAVSFVTLTPELNIVLFVLNKGTDYQDVIRIGPVLAALSAGVAFASQFAVKNKAELEQKLNKIKDDLL